MDDKIIRAANEEGVTWDVIANRYIKAYFEVMDKLHVKRAHIYPRVSEHIPDIIHTVQELINNGYGYVVDGDVYYRVERFSHYGELSGRKLDDMMAGARVDVDERKENPMISPCGNPPNRENLPGTAPGAKAGRAGTLNAPP